MYTFALKQKPTQRTRPATSGGRGQVSLVQSQEVRSILDLQRTVGNQAVQRLLEAGTRNVKRDSVTDNASVGHDFSRIPVHAPIQSSIQSTLKVGSPGNKYEQEADQVADRVVQAKLPEGGSSGETESHSALQNTETRIQLGSDLGKPLDTSTKEEMSRKIGFDFSNVRIHTDDLAIYLNKGLNARAFTHGSDIYFNEGEYNPNSLSGNKLLAHELTHVVQQSQMTDETAKREMIQCTTIGQILDTFFSPISKEKLWVMPASDNYTKIVRKWKPVINAVKKAKANLEANCANWKAKHKTSTSWKPGKTDPPVTDPNAHGIWVASPPGTDPKTCAKAFTIYVTSKAHPLFPTIQTFELYTCSIGSFGIYATVDSIDCAAKKAKMNIWMYNAMDMASFGKFAKYFPLSGMKRQYMWWNWSETHSWSSSSKPGGGGSKGGSGGW